MRMWIVLTLVAICLSVLLDIRHRVDDICHTDQACRVSMEAPG